MASVALREMMTVAREEASIMASEGAAVVRATATSEAAVAVRSAGHEALNPVAIREEAAAVAKQAIGTNESSLLSMLGRANPGEVKAISSSTSTVTNTVLSEAGAEASSVSTTSMTVTTETSVVGRVLERDMGVTVKEAMTNAGETGVQETTEQTLEAVQGFFDGKLNNHPVRAGTMASATV
ncbi:uncharacterized protein EHS24_008949 [Apiotrichum porosum]|uniref:Uncharacterized protein n=1 Tax=Apiotrichum porosum TaxID=105984 RepID=A0A427XNI8_9TREE|nr:uncharacterized protein EHS24_008949 [Apiotrichum porosum]RSH80373.1 hypothetical protein EHS24_008949 [Apiotrichum porosum]